MCPSPCCHRCLGFSLRAEGLSIVCDGSSLSICQWMELHLAHVDNAEGGCCVAPGLIVFPHHPHYCAFLFLVHECFLLSASLETLAFAHLWQPFPRCEMGHHVAFPCLWWRCCSTVCVGTVLKCPFRPFRSFVDTQNWVVLFIPY